MVRDSLEGFQKAGVFRALKFTKRSKCGVPVTEGCGVNVQRQVSTAGLRLLFLGPACKVGLCWHLGSCILGRFSPFPHWYGWLAVPKGLWVALNPAFPPLSLELSRQRVSNWPASNKKSTLDPKSLMNFPSRWHFTHVPGFALCPSAVMNHSCDYASGPVNLPSESPNLQVVLWTLDIKRIKKI